MIYKNKQTIKISLDGLVEKKNKSRKQKRASHRIRHFFDRIMT
jgi:sulfatase maturation enzyme AslB (radical SAM superfamily)